jgi:hypothetical protein
VSTLGILHCPPAYSRKNFFSHHLLNMNKSTKKEGGVRSGGKGVTPVLSIIKITANTPVTRQINENP